MIRAHWVLALALSVASILLARPSAQAQSDTGSTDAEARALFNAGEIAFGDGRWEAALDYFQRAYDLSHRPALLFNIGSAAEHMRRDDVALDAFRRFLVEVPDTPTRAAVESRIAVLERAVAASQATTSSASTTTTTTTTTSETEHTSDASAAHDDAPPPSESASTSDASATPPDAPSASGGSDPAPWIVLGIGGAVLVAGAILVGVGLSDIATVQNAADGATLSSIQGAHDDAPVLTGAGWACVAVGAAAVIAGAVWGVVGSGSSSAQVTASGWLDGRSGGLVVRGTF